MKQYGYVTEINDNIIKVRVIRESSCGGNCVSCKGCPSEAVIIECEKNEDYCLGEKVCLLMNDKTYYKGLFWGYGQLILLTVILSVLGYCIFKTELSSVLGGGIGLTLGILISKLIFKNKKVEIRAEKIC